ncbi:MAG: hypothetical protein JWM80_2095 [Cyanobacteria bacterium RYN_339]|nr:hypothetical protein [Cyanobacteria bacterium RYN_339]
MNISSVGSDVRSPVTSRAGVDPAAYALAAMQGADDAAAQSMARMATGTVNGEAVDTYA